MTTIATKNFQSLNYFSNTANNQLNINQNLIGQDLMNIGLNANYNAMNGEYQIPFTDRKLVTGNNLGSLEAVSSFRFMTFVNANMNERYWNILGNASGSVQSINIVISGSSRSSFVKSQIANPTSGFNSTFFSQSLIYAGAGLAKDDVTVRAYKVTADSSTAASFTGYSLLAAPQAFINPTLSYNQQGVDIESLKPFKPIFSAPSFENSSIAGIAKTIDYARNSVIPAKGLFCVASPYELSAGVTNYIGGEMVSFSALSDVSMSALIHATSMDLTQSSRLVNWYAFVGVQDAAQPGKLDITSSYGTSTKTFSNTTPAWISGSVRIPTETLSLDSAFDASLINGSTGSVTFRLIKTVSTTGAYASIWTIQFYEGTEL